MNPQTFLQPLASAVSLPTLTALALVPSSCRTRTEPSRETRGPEASQGTAASGAASGGSGAEDSPRNGAVVPPRRCTEIGCRDTTTFKASVPIQGAELKGPGGDFVALCDGFVPPLPEEVSCEGNTFRVYGVFDSAVVRMGSKLTEVNLKGKYTVIRPNGPGCEPECRHAEIVLP